MKLGPYHQPEEKPSKFGGHISREDSQTFFLVKDLVRIYLLNFDFTQVVGY